MDKKHQKRVKKNEETKISSSGSGILPVYHIIYSLNKSLTEHKDTWNLGLSMLL